MKIIIEITESEQQKIDWKIQKTIKQSLGACGTVMPSESQKVRRESGTGKACKEMMGADFPHMAKDLSLQSQEAE